MYPKPVVDNGILTTIPQLVSRRISEPSTVAPESHGWLERRSFPFLSLYIFRGRHCATKPFEGFKFPRIPCLPPPLGCHQATRGWGNFLPFFGPDRSQPAVGFFFRTNVYKNRGWQATRVQFFIDLWNWNITSYHKFSSSYKDMKFDYIF